MKWLMQFYHERRGLLAPYSVDAALPAEAILLGWKAVLAEYPPIPGGRRPSSFEQAQRIGGQHASGWVLYRLAATREDSSPETAQPRVA